MNIPVESGESHTASTSDRPNAPEARNIPVVWRGESESPTGPGESTKTSEHTYRPIEPDDDDILRPGEHRERTTQTAGLPYTQLIINKFQIHLHFSALPKIPSYKEIRAAYFALPRRQRIALTATGSFMLLTIAVLPILNNNSGPPPNSPLLAAQGLPKETPSFKALLPSGKTIESLGGWRRVSPADTSPVYTYVDTIENVRINVSEQPLPPNLEDNTDEGIEKLAQSFNATLRIPAGEGAIYIGTSANGTQSAITTKKDLLILLKADTPLNANQWANYVESLR